MKKGFLHLSLAFVLALLAGGCSRESRKAGHLDRGNRYFQTADLSKAEIEYLLVLRLDPANPTAIARLGSIYYDQGNPSKAFAFLQKAKELTPNDIETRKKLALIFLSGRSFDDAKREADFLLANAASDPEVLVLAAEIPRNSNDVLQVAHRLESLRPQSGNTPGYQVAQGILLFRQNKISEAEAAFKSALALDPKFAAAHSALAHLYLAQNDLKRAEESLKAAASFSPVRSSRQLEYIDFKLRTGGSDEARKLLDQLIAQAPDYLPALARQAELALVENRVQDASNHLSKIAARDPQNYEGLLLQARLLLAQGEPDKAIALLERTAAVFAKVPQVPYQLAIGYLSKMDTAKAIQALNTALSMDPNFTEATLLLAEIHLRQGETATAVAELNALIRKQPNLAQPYLLLANAYRAQNALNNVLQTYSRLMELFPKNAQIPTLAGAVYLQQNRGKEARAAFEKSLQLAPNYLPALEQLINLDIAEKQVGAASDRLQKESEKFPKSPELQILFARVYQAQRDTNKAEQALLKAIEWAPTYREPYFLLAKLYVQKNEYQGAIDNLKGVIGRNPKDIGALMLLGTIYDEIKNYGAERETYEKLLALDPRFAPALNNLAYLYSEHFDELQKAFDMAQRARELRPLDAAAADTLGWILFKRHQYPWALNLLQESADKLSDRPEVLYHLGMARYVMGQEQAARDAFERALQQPRAFLERDDCARRLSVLKSQPDAADPALVKNLESQLAAQPNDPVAWSRLAAIYERTGSFDKAKSAYESALNLNPKNAPVLLGLAELYETHFKNPQKAIELAKSARTLVPDDPKAGHILGRLALQSGDPSEIDWALSVLRESQRKAPEDPEIAFDLAWAYFSVGRIADAEMAMQKVIKAAQASPRRDSANLFLRMLALAKTPKDAAQATAEIQNALKEDPTYAPALMASGAASEQQRDTKAAQLAYETVLSHFPGFEPAHKRLSALLLEQNPDKAFDHALKARDSMPDDPEATRLAGVAAFKRNDFSRSAQFLRQSARAFPKDAEVYYYLGLAHYRLNQKSESKEALRQALALNIPSGMADEANRVLAELN